MDATHQSPVQMLTIGPWAWSKYKEMLAQRFTFDIRLGDLDTVAAPLRSQSSERYEAIWQTLRVTPRMRSSESASLCMSNACEASQCAP